MFIIRKAQERGFTNLGWLQSYHTFSFGSYYDPLYLGFESLRVINEDRVEAGSGFGAHSHQNMEIISYVLEGTLKHKDSMGNTSLIKAGEVQRMSAGTGVTHSEFNPSQVEEVHFLQIWFLPTHQGLAPSYEQKYFSPVDKQGKLLLIASQQGRQGSLSLHQDVDLWAALLDQKSAPLSYPLQGKRKAWVHVVQGHIKLNDSELESGDGVGITSPQSLSFVALQPSEILIFDMAAL